MSAYAKAIAAAVLGALGTAAVILQAAVTDDSITSAEWVTAGIAFVTALASTAGVYAAENKTVKHGPVEKFGRESGVGGFKPPDQPTA